MSTKITASRHHEIHTGHRVVGQGGKCEHVHGHAYVFHFTIEADQLNDIGMILDFGVIKDRLCEWLEDNWDHKFLLWDEDPWLEPMQLVDFEGVVAVPFNPTAENMAKHMIEVVGPQQLAGTGTRLIHVKVHETTKCNAEAWA